MIVKNTFLERKKKAPVIWDTRRTQIRRIVHALESYQEKQLKVESSVTICDVMSNYEPEEVISHDTAFHFICYNGCSNINPRLAETCDKLGNYYLICPTYKARLNGGSK